MKTSLSISLPLSFNIDNYLYSMQSLNVRYVDVVDDVEVQLEKQVITALGKVSVSCTPRCRERRCCSCA